MRLIYQPYELHGACGLIDRGFINGLREIGVEVVVWDSERSESHIMDLLRAKWPTHFMGYLQMPSRQNAKWVKKETLETLVDYRAQYGLKTVVCSFPSNIRDLYGGWLQGCTVAMMDPVTASYYGQSDRPNEDEERVLRSGFIDVITARYAESSLRVGFRNFLERGVPVLSQLPAADVRELSCGWNEKEQTGPEILFIGNCWPFKWSNMSGFVGALKEAFGEKCCIYGDGWPDGVSNGPLGVMDDTALFARTVRRAKILLSLHEPSQVLSFATSTNERVYKLLALGCFVLSDKCGADLEHFRANEDLVVANDGPDAVVKAKECLMNAKFREVVAKTGQRTCLEGHTYRHRVERLLTLLEAKTGGVGSCARE